MNVINLNTASRRARDAALVLGAALFVGGLMPQTIHSQAFDRIERERTLSMLSNIKEELKNNYYDPKLRGMDVDARFKIAEEKLKQATSLGQAFGIIAQVLLDLDDSHTTFTPPSRALKVEYGWQMQAIGNQCFISAVKPGSDADAQGVKVGDLVVSLDGFKPSRKELWKIEYYYYALSPRPGVRLVLQSPGHEPREVDVASKVRQEKRVLKLDTSDIHDLIRESEDNSRLQRQRFHRLGDIVIWKMPSFDFVPEEVDSIFSEQVEGRSALILDLRGNLGGYVSTLQRIAGHFFDHEVKIADLKGRKQKKPILAKKGGNIFAGKLIVLVDSKSASCSEVFARLIQIEKRGIVIGDLSMGAVMQAIYHEQALGVNRLVYYGANITDADVIMSDGKSLEHVGVIPDELILPTPADMAAHRDHVMVRAVELLGMKLDSAKAGELFPLEWK